MILSRNKKKNKSLLEGQNLSSTSKRKYRDEEEAERSSASEKNQVLYLQVYCSSR